MKIIIVGCGKIGTTILTSLLNEGHDIMAVDTDPEVVASISNMYDIMCVCGNGVDCDTLTEADIEHADLFVATTGSDELNMLSCFLAKRMGARHTVARIRNPEYSDQSLGFMRHQLDISMAINPDRVTAQEIDNVLKFPTATKVEYFFKRSFSMVEITVRENSPLLDVPLHELRKRYAAKFLICAVLRGDRVTIPDGNFTLKVGDRIELTAAPNELQKLLREIGILQKKARSVMILGASRIGYYLAKSLIAGGNTVKIIEKDHRRCQEISELLPQAIVLHGDGSQHELLLEEGISSMDAFVSLTGMDEENILFSFFAHSQGVKKVITKVNRDDLIPIAARLGLDGTVSSKNVASGILCRYARAIQNSLGSNMETLYKLLDGKAEALEFRVQDNFSKLDTPLKEMRLKHGLLISGILRGRKPIIPSGTDVIQKGDRVIVLAADHTIHDLEDILQ